MFRSKSAFEKVFDKATSNLLLEPDLDSMLQLCDMIRGGDIKAREAMTIVKTRVLEEKNPHVQFFSVSVLDTLMKNCGEEVHAEVLTKSYLESIKDLVKSSTSENVKNKLLEMIQAWGVGFKNKPKLEVAPNLYNIMKAEGYKFPQITDTSDMFKAEKAPVWTDGNECSNCKVEFGFVQRKHHCRACGGIFCNKCTSKQAIIPKFGIEKEVRVCDSCFSELVKKSNKSTEDDLPIEYLNSSLAKQSQDPPKRDDAALKEEEELQLALALSLDEQENKHRIRKEQIDATYGTVNKVSPPPAQPHAVDPEVDPDLARYLNRSYWDKKKVEQDQQQTTLNSDKTAATLNTKVKEEVTIGVTNDKVSEPLETEESLQNGEVTDNTELLNNLRTSVEIFVNRMRSDEMRGRSIANDSTVQSLFQSINNMHPSLIQFMNELEEKRLHQEALQDKLVQIRDARAALDALRAEHAEKLRRAAEEADRQRQIQMAQKLEVMRQKKQEYLAYQRQMALQRMQEQEAARQARLEQHKQFIQHRAMQPSMLIAGYNTQYHPSLVNEISGDQQPQQQGAYPQYGGGGYMQTPPQQQQQQYHPSSMPYQPMQQPNTGYAPQTNYPNNNAYESSSYQQQGAISGQTAPPIQNQPGMEAYNLADMSAALPNTQPSNQGMPPQHQVVATAPPPTPQPGQNPQALVSMPVDPNMGGYPLQQQQSYYQQPPQDTQAQPSSFQTAPAASAPQNQELLISFD